jgi:hypothetical protein
MQYTRLEYNLDEIADKGRGSIKYRVFGYRDADVVELEITRRDRASQLWTITPNRSGYISREYDQEPNDINAMENTVAALQDAITLGREIEKDIPRLEARFQAAEAVRKAEADRIAAEKKAKYDADPAVGMKLAKHIIKQMAYEIKAKDGGHWDEITIKLATRGERKDEDLKVRYSRYGKTLFNLGWYRVSKDRALAMLADSAIDSLKVDGINIVDPKLAKFMMV